MIEIHKIPNDTILYNGSDYYRFYTNRKGELEMISCTKGYLHNVKQSDLENFEIIGSFESNKHLLECD